MNNNDLSFLMNMVNNMDKNQLAQGINQINQMLSPEDKAKLIQALNSKIILRR